VTDERAERVRWLMMGALDGELAPAEEAEWAELLSGDESLREEWNRMRRIKEVTQEMAIKSPPDHMWSEYWTSVYRRLERGAAWVFVSLGSIVLIAYGAWKAIEDLIADAALPWFIKAAILVLGLGLVILAVSVVREKVFVAKSDPFKDVER
jgi:anti-sigma factor RsiW